MDRFEYQLLVWAVTRSGEDLVATLNILGGDGWEAVGMAPRGSEVPMAGMGAMAINEVAIVLKRRVPG